MAKSLRSKSKLRAKSIKRKGEFSKYVDGRNQRLAQKMVEHAQKQEEAKANKPEAVAEEESMDLDAKVPKTADEKKVSTSGWRDSRTQIYKKVKAKKSKKNKALKF